MELSIREWLNGKDILITGGTGFLGKGLLEKLLRTTNVNQIYAIIRNKRGQNPMERKEKLFKDLVFERLHRERPEAFDKVVVINGDMTAEGLGISEKDKEELKNISVIFHSAACVRFDDPLSSSLLTNVRSTKEMINLAKTIPKLECFHYVSTAFANYESNVDKVEEKIYHYDHDWRVLVDLAEKDSEALNLIQTKILNDHLNTYTFCKALSEMMLEEHKDELPIVITRPSVVTSSIEEPEPGWIDNYRGVVGFTVAFCSGVLRVFRTEADQSMDCIPADCVINAIIVTSWERSKKQSVGLDIFNIVTQHYKVVTFKEFMDEGLVANDESPINNDIWYPFMVLCRNTFIYHLLFYILQLLPGFILDTLLILLKKKPRLTHINNVIYKLNLLLERFATKPISFDNTNYQRLCYRKLPNDVENDLFKLQPKSDFSFEKYIFTSQKGIKKFLLNEKESDLERLKKKYRRLFYIHRSAQIILISATVWYSSLIIYNTFTYLRENYAG